MIFHRTRPALFLRFALFLGCGPTLAFDHSHLAWTTFLGKYTQELPGPSTSVDYALAKQNRAELQAYLKSLAAVTPAEFKTWNRNQKLAFWINAYNASTVDLVASHYPVQSIKDIGSLFKSAWKQPFIQLLGKTMTLDDVEHGTIRPQFKEPLVHFALVCAARSCPRLQRQAYVPDSLTTQLERASREFLTNKQRNRVVEKAQDVRLEISRIFDWYAEDFGSEAQLRSFLAARMNLSASQRQAVVSGQAKINNREYDWKLNDVR